MSLIPADTAPGISELPSLLRRWMTIQEETAALNNELKQRRTQSKALKDVILRIMETNKVAALNVSKGTVIHKVSETPERLNNSSLLKHFRDFFNGDEVRATALIEYLDEHRASSVKHDLKLQMPRADDDVLSHRS